MALYKPGSSSSSVLPGRTEFEILKSSHKFLREDDEQDKSSTWEEKVAQKYYATLYREYAVCDLKHYKSGNFALRWRTEAEVISGAGETTCGNTRCPLHSSRNIDPDDPGCSLKTLELPFSYAEGNETKFALVKVVLCDRCCTKLMWKRNKDKERGSQAVVGEEQSGEDVGRVGGDESGRKAGGSVGLGEGKSMASERGRSESALGTLERASDVPGGTSRRSRRDGKETKEKQQRRRSPRHSRSLSPRRTGTQTTESRRRRHSPS